MSLLERTLHEVAACAASGILPATAVVAWPADGVPPAVVAVPARLRVQHRRGAPGAFVASSVLVLSGDLLVGPGSLARWLGTATRVDGRPGIAELAGDDPRLDNADPADLAAELFGPPAGRPASPASADVWLRVVGPGDAAGAERRLFASLGKVTDGFAARRLNRPVSTRLSRWLARAGVRPDAWTALLLLLTLVSAAVLVRGDAAGFVLGAVLFNLISILDGCDGEIARVCYRETARGARLDTLADMISHHVFVLGLGAGLARQPGLAAVWQRTYLSEGVLTAVGIALTLWGASTVDRGWQQEGHFRDFGTSVLDTSGLTGLKRRLGRAIADATRQDTYRWVWIPIALLGRPAWILHAFAVGVVAHLIALAYVWAKGAQPVAGRRRESGGS